MMPDWITLAIKKRIEDEMKVLIEKAKKDLDYRVPEIVAGICVDVMSMAQMQILQDRIVFEIRKK